MALPTMTTKGASARKLLTGVTILVFCLAIALAACEGDSKSDTAASSYALGGTATGLSGTVVLQNDGGDDLTLKSSTLNADGDFTFDTPLDDGSSYEVTVLTQPDGQTCTVSNGSGTVSAANVTDVAVSCVDDPTSTMISGTAAAGENIVGYVAAKDDAGTVVYADIDPDDGSFGLDLAGMTPPVLLYAAGLSGSLPYTLISVALEDDLGGTVNITPLTDLATACVVGNDTEQFFNDPDFSLLTAENLDASQASLKGQLADLLAGFGIDADFDLYTSPFDAGGTGFDSLLDALDVQIDIAAETAEVTFRGDGSSATYDMTSCANGDDFSTEATAIADYQTAQQAALDLKDALIALHAGGTPASADFEPYVHPDALHKGHGYDTVLGIIAGLPEALWEAINFKLYEFVQGTDRNVGTIFFGDEKWLLWDDGDGWQFAGDQQNWGGFIDVYPDYDQQNGGIVTTLSIQMSGNLGKIGPDDYIVASGPGVDLVLSEYGESPDEDPPTSGLEVFTEITNAEVAEFYDRAEYTMTRYTDANGTPGDTSDDTEGETYLAVLRKRPLVNATSANLAEITSPTLNQMRNYTGGDITVTWSRPDFTKNRSVSLWLLASDGSSTYQVEVTDAVWENLDPEATSVTFTPPELAAGDSYVGIAYIEVNIFDVFARWFNTYIDDFGFQN